MWHYPALFKDTMKFGRKTESWNRLDPNLASFATMAAAGAIGCSFCLDLHYFMAHNRGLDEAKAREVPRWRESTAFTPLERRVMEYAEAMCQTPLTVTDEMSAALLEELGAPALLELTARIGVDEHDRPGQRRARHPVAGVLGVLRPAAARGPVGGRRRLGMTDDPFIAHRSLLFTVAYEMLGSAADADDVVQETWLRWAEVDRAAVRDPRAYLVRIVTRQALNRLRTLSRRREDYVGEWLPEPLLTSPDVAEDVELAESVSIAMLTVLETLGPTERAVFVLHEVFDVPYDEIAEAVGKSSAAVRQIAHRAREHVAARRPRMAVSRTEQQQVVDRFLAALTAGDVQGLMDVLAPDVVVVADSGGLAPAARRPVVGRERVAVGALPLRGVRAGRGDHHAAAQRRGRRADRPGRRVRHGDHLRRRGRPDHPHVRDAQPAQAGPARRGGRAAAVTASRRPTAAPAAAAQFVPDTHPMVRNLIPCGITCAGRQSSRWRAALESGRHLMTDPNLDRYIDRPEESGSADVTLISRGHHHGSRGGVGHLRRRGPADRRWARLGERRDPGG